MAVSSICLPEPLQHEDARSWFKRFELCAAANEWNAAKQLLHLPTLLRGRSWAIYELLIDADKESYDALKKAILNRLDPDTDEHQLAARDQLSQRCLHEGLESIDELARDLEKILGQDFHLQRVKQSYAFTWLTPYLTMWHSNWSYNPKPTTLLPSQRQESYNWFTTVLR